jgi:hypothetical protein
MVTSWTVRYGHPAPSEPSVTNDSRLRPGTGRIVNRSTTTARPISSRPRMSPRAASAWRARSCRGRWKAGVALAMASTPVNAAQPLAKAANTSSTPTEPIVAGCVGVGSGCSGAPLSSPITITVAMASTNTAVGRMNSRALATTPRRLIPMITASATRHSSTVQGSSGGKPTSARPPSSDRHGHIEHIVHH